MKYVILFLMVFLFGGCSAPRVVEVEKAVVRVDSVYITQALKDSIFVKDSVFVREKGDTVYLDRCKYVYKYLASVDTVQVLKVDSVRVPYPVEAKLTRWQKTKQEAGGAAIAIVVFIIIIVSGRFLHKIR